MKNHYIQALIATLESGTLPEEALKGLRTSLKAHQHERLLPAILRGTLKVLESSNRSQTATVTVASASAAKEAIANALKDIDAPNDASVIVDPTIIGGVVAKYKNMVVDRSYKSKLVELYRSAKR